MDMLKKKIQKQAHCATGPTFADSLALQKLTVTCSVVASSIGILLEDTHTLYTPKYVRTFFQKKAFHRVTNLFRQIFLFWGWTWGD